MSMNEDRDMQRIDGRTIYSASDLNNFLECVHLSELERLAAFGEIERPSIDETTQLLARKGSEHEARHLARLQRIYGEDVAVLRQAQDDRAGAYDDKGDAHDARSVAAWVAAEARTVAAMASGARIIYQAAFFDGTFLGYADFLRRVERPCARWAWSYEAIDTKLALSPKPYYLLQLCNYSEHLERVQGTRPHDMHIVLGSGEERRFRVDDFIAYYRHIKVTFLERMSTANETYPFEVGHCAICRYRPRCVRQRDRDDHLSLVAAIRRDQIAKLEGNGIPTLAALAQARDTDRPFGMEQATFTKLRAQAALQHTQRTQQRYVYELLDHDPGAGFELLPEPDEGDVFFDMEGDPLYSPERGLEYLFGAYLASDDSYHTFWARSDRDERAAFESFIDFVTERRKCFPRMHIYHYAPYETTALRRLMGFYGTRERELDDLLRNEVFVDLYAVVRQALRISQPSYSIKKLEAFYGMTRSTEVQRGDDSIVMFESWLASGDDSILEDIERYNDDDCRSTYLLREWLLERRREREATTATKLTWRTQVDREIPDDDGRSDLAQELLQALPAPHTLRELRNAGDSVRARWLLAYLLDYHAREAKPAYWQLHDRYDNVDRLLEFDHEAIGGLRIRNDVAPFKQKPRDRSLVYTYEFPDQQHNLGTDTPYCPDARTSAGTVVSFDDERNVLQIKLSGAIRPDRLRALIPGKPVETRAQRTALTYIAQTYLAQSLEREYPATLSLLLARAPRFSTRRERVQPETVDARSISEIIAALDRSHLVIQGPPGSGKSTLGAAFIVDLLADGKRVGIVANGHKAIHNLLHKVEERATSQGVRVRGLQKFSASNDGSAYHSALAEAMVRPTPDNGDFTRESHELAAGTSWLFAREELRGSYDYLIVDEAGQMSLADALACSLAARNVVLLGDPLQLAQVSQGSHPLGTDASVLQHLLGDDETVDPRCGIFLDTSYRMHPEICSFISHALYEDRLHAAAVCARNAIDSPGLAGSGLRYLPIAHENNSRASDEEAHAIVAEITKLLQGTVTVGERAPRPLTPSDILVVSPYNAQRKRIRKYLAQAGLEIRVGTVDKFQGQEAPVVFYSMATSSGANLPRDLAFLFEKNRLNVAISRAQCMSILVCSPALLQVRCSTPEQMALVNLLCRFAEMGSLQADSALIS